MIKPILSIIIVSYNTAEITLDCLKSLLADKGLDFFHKSDNSEKSPAEIIIIDNNSSDNSPELIKKYFASKNLPPSAFKIIQNHDNAGFGKANNQGIKVASGNYLLLLNSDTIILHSAVSQALTWLSSHPESYMCTAQLLNTDNTIQGCGGYFPNLANIFTWATGLDDLPIVNKIIKPFHPHTPDFYTHDSFFLKDHPQDWLTGAFMLIRSSVLDDSTIFDENYFMYGEEYEMVYRIKKKYPKKQAWYLVGPQIVHLGGASSQTKTFPIIKEITGVLGFFQKHKPVWQFRLVRFILKANPSIRLRYLFNRLVGNEVQARHYLEICSKM